MACPNPASPQFSFKLLLPDRLSCDIPFRERLKFPLYKDPERYELYLNAAFLTANIAEDRFCFMLERGMGDETVELVIPALPSSTIGLNSPRTKRLILFSAIKSYVKYQYHHADKKYSKEIKLLNEFMVANEAGNALNFETQREVDTILASNISVTELIESLISEPRIRYLWIPVEGKSGSAHRLRLCDTELALCSEESDVALHVWPWPEVGEPKCSKLEVRMAWLITDERPNLSPVLVDILHSKRPESLNEAKRRRLSRSNSIHSATVSEAKYQYTIVVSAKDTEAARKLVYQINCIRAMAFANDTQPRTEPLRDAEPVPAGKSTSKSKKSVIKKKKVGFSFCGLNCMGGKNVKGTDSDDEPLSSPRSQSVANAALTAATAATAVALPNDLQKTAAPVQEALPLPAARPAATPRKLSLEKGDIESPKPLTSGHQSNGIVGLSSFAALNPPNPQYSPVLAPVIQNKENDPLSLTFVKEGNKVDGSDLKPQAPQVPPSPMQRESNGAPPSPGGKSLSGIPLPRNPTRAMVGITHQSSSQSEPNQEPVSASSPSQMNTPVNLKTSLVAQNCASKGGETPKPASPVSPGLGGQTKWISGLVEPKVVVTKPGINVYKGRNSPAVTALSAAAVAAASGASNSPSQPGPDGDSRSAEAAPSSPTSLSLQSNGSPMPGSGGKQSNIRPPSVAASGGTGGGAGRYTPRSVVVGGGAGSRSSSGSRIPSVGSGQSSPLVSPSSPSTGHSGIPVPRTSPATGIRMPSRLPRQTLAK